MIDIIMNKIFYIDLFSGAGGTTTGIHNANNPNIEVVACVNHDVNAIKSHKANHPNCFHFTEDVRSFSVVVKLREIVNNLRNKHPNCIIVIWASLECTNFSNAKGGPKNADSRTLAYSLNTYIDELLPDYVMIENVREFKAWGPLDKKGIPISRTKGRDYIQWVNYVKSMGYNFDDKMFNSADFDSVQSRNRFFAQFYKIGMPLSWPEPTRTKKPINGLFNDLLPWRAVREVLDLSHKGVSIFGINRKNRHYADKTIQRVFIGLKKHYKEFLTSYYGNGGAHSIEVPCNTITTKDRFSYHFVNYDYSKAQSSSINTVIGTLTTVPKPKLVSFLIDYQYNNKGRSINKPSPTLIARMDKSPMYLISTNESSIIDQRYIDVEESAIRKELRAYMRKHNIKDVTIRPLSIPELLQIQGFPKDYNLVGTIDEQKKYIGNAVDTNVAKAIAIAHSKPFL